MMVFNQTKRNVNTLTQRLFAKQSPKGCRRRIWRRSLSMEALQSRELMTVNFQDFLLVADTANDTVQQFDAKTAAHVGTFVTSGSAGLYGPRGLVFDRGKLLVVNQNVDQPFAGEVLRYAGKTGLPILPALIPASNPQAPFAPRGIVVRDNVIYVADYLGADSPRIAKYNASNGDFLGDLKPSNFAAPFNPRGLVFGPDGKLYVTSYSAEESVVFSQDPSGYILRFRNTTSGSVDVIARNNGDGQQTPDETANLHNPEGIVFGPDGRLYVLSFRFDGTDNVILGFDINSNQIAKSISLGNSYGQGLLFGPNGALYVSVSGGSDSGSIRAYASNGDFNGYVVEAGGVLTTPWYMTFKQTDPATLEYKPWHNFVNPLDVDENGFVVPLDVLLVVNELNSHALTDNAGRLPAARHVNDPYYFDVTGDGYVVPLDALRIVNFLNGHPTGEGESGWQNAGVDLPPETSGIPAAELAMANSGKYLASSRIDQPLSAAGTAEGSYADRLYPDQPFALRIQAVESLMEKHWLEPANDLLQSPASSKPSSLEKTFDSLASVNSTSGITLGVRMFHLPFNAKRVGSIALQDSAPDN